MLYSHETTIRIHIHAETKSTIMTNEHTSLEKYTSHSLFSKGLRKGWYWLCVRGELETEQTATYWPQVPLTIAALLSHFAGLLNQGPLRAANPLSGAGSHCLELQLELQLTDSNLLKPSVATDYIIVWHPPASCGRLHRIQPCPQVKVIPQHL